MVDVRFAGDHHRIEVTLGDGTRVVLRSARHPGVATPGAPVVLVLAATPCASSAASPDR
jgi:hypothetical protein